MLKGRKGSDPKYLQSASPRGSPTPARCRGIPPPEDEAFSSQVFRSAQIGSAEMSVPVSSGKSEPAFLGYVPECWRRAKVVFIPKPGKEDCSFRPITLTSFVFKTLEQVVLGYFEDTYNVYDRRNVNQHAFWISSSCDLALSDMVDEIESSILPGHFALGIFLVSKVPLITSSSRQESGR